MLSRRTGQSGPLGELFDHCVDAVNTTLSAIIFASAIGLGYSWILVITQFGCLMNFYLSTWEEFHTHKLFLSEFSGPVEGILMIIAIFTTTGVVGPDLWSLELVQVDLSFIGLDPEFKITSTVAFIIFSAVSLYFNIESARRNVDNYYGDARASLQAYIGLIPFFVYYATVFAWLFYNPIIVEQFLLPFILTIGLTLAFHVGRIIIGHLTKQSFPYTTPSSFIPLVQFLIFLLLTPLGYDASSLTGSLIWTGLGLSLGLHAMFITEIIYEITTYLDIYALSIKYPKKE
jgi:ethanolaminephosphotransferase/diacylglycerol cholinephosphotransferase